MRRPSLVVAAVLLIAGLAGCASPAKTTTTDLNTEIDRQLLDAAAKIQVLQAELYQAGVLSRRPPPTQSGSLDASQAITLAWQGDALQLLSRLARDRGLQFAFMGVRQPLPVNVNVRLATFDTVLAQVRAQVGYRAEITLQPDTLVLHFNAPRATNG